jgi:hypothetical protein
MGRIRPLKDRHKSRARHFMPPPDLVLSAHLKKGPRDAVSFG